MTVVSKFWLGIIPIISSKIAILITATSAALVYILAQRSAHEVRKRKTILIIEEEKQWEDGFSLLQRSIQINPFIGLDCEWVTGANGKRNKVALLQIASVDGLCLLVRLNIWKSYFPCSLIELLEDDKIFKAGIGIKQDSSYLGQDYGLFVNGWIDLRNLCAQNKALKSFGLSALAKHYLSWDVDKNWRVRCSDWEADHLNFNQIEYAANDAYIGVLLYQKISVQLIQSSFFESNYKYWRRVNSHWMSFLDCDYKQSRNKQNDVAQLGLVANSSALRGAAKTLRHPLRRTPLYDNCLLCAPDGEVLCTCNERKANWYCQKNLGYVSNDNPLTVTLYFEPKGRPINDDCYYVLHKDNLCVVCGKDSCYLRKNIVPHEYRRYFPKIMKEHQSHDILLLCLNCHQRSGLHDNALKMTLCEEIGFSRNLEYCHYKEDPAVKKVRSAARALLKNESLPPMRVTELQEVLMQYFGIKELTQSNLEEASKLNIRMSSCDIEPHGQRVVKYFGQHGGLVKFERRWREHFIIKMKPQYLPPLWSITHNTDRIIRKIDSCPYDPELVVILFGSHDYKTIN